MGKAVIIVFILGFSIVVQTEAKTIGDFNDDGVINISDVVALIMHITGHGEIPEVGQAIDRCEDDYFVPKPTMGLDGPNAVRFSGVQRAIESYPHCIENT